MRLFSARLSGLFSVLLIIAIYQVVSVQRANAEEIAQLQYELTESQNELNEMLSASGDGASGGSGSYIDGTYEGQGQGYGGAIVVSVTVSGGNITAIDVTSHAGEDTAYYTLASNITNNIISAQSADVDVINGATLSSTGIKNAVKAALADAQ